MPAFAADIVPPLLRALLLLPQLLLALILWTGSCGAGELSEYQVKAAFVLNLARYTEWPPQELSGSQEIRVCTVGSDPFRQAFDALNGKQAKGKAIVVKHLAQPEGAQDCQVLFVGESMRRQVPRVLRAVQGAPILTIAEVEEFPEAGGMVNLLVEKNKTVLEVNHGALKRAGLQVSAQVLKVARRVLE